MKRLRETNNASGFTIIEVLIVLAIAGLILLVVFEAIPVLQRNSRNDQRRQDVGTILQDVSHYELNHSGDIPDGPTLRNDLQNSSHRLTIYDPADSATPDIDVIFTNLDQTAAIPANGTNVNQVRVYNHAKCDANSPGNATNSGAGYNDVVALFSAESGNSSTPTRQCQQL